MYLKRNKKHAAVIVFFLCFVVYAISPISYTGSANWFDNEDSIIQKEGSSRSNIGIFFLKIVFSNFNDNAADDANATLCLFKKIKATLQSPIDPKRVPAEPVILSGDHTDFRVAAVFCKEVREETPKHYYDNLLFEFSGLSPPLNTNS
jgi:hypothetical protein